MNSEFMTLVYVTASDSSKANKMLKHSYNAVNSFRDHNPDK